MGMTDYLEEQLGNHLFRSGTFAKPAEIHMGLFTTLPTADDGSGGVEIVGASYARVEYGPDDSAWAAPVGGNGEFYNVYSIVFPTPQEDWGTVVGWGLFDAATGGNLLLFAALASNKNVPNGAPAPEFNPGAVKFTLD
jgi:hypothetical protein